MWSYIDNVIAPFIDCVREDLAVGKDQVALAIFDTFKGQLTPKVTQCLEKHNIQSQDHRGRKIVGIRGTKILSVVMTVP